MWTKDQIEILKTLWRRGESARIIALQLRTTRNAVIGKANRLKLHVHPSRSDEIDNDQITNENSNIEDLYKPKICSKHNCNMTSQPGRDYCAFHCRQIIEEQKKQKKAS